jgi:membrane protease YdiL (CAAX protease family)
MSTDEEQPTPEEQPPEEQPPEEQSPRPPEEQSPRPPEEQPPRWYDPTTRKGWLIEALIVFSLATLVCSMVWQLRGVSSFIAQNLQAFIAAVFLYLPTGLLLKRKESFERYGLTHKPLGRGLLFFLVPAAIVFPLFAVGFYYYYGAVCGAAGLTLPRGIRWYCSRWVGHISRARLKLPPDFLQVVAAQLLVVALPEEYFFRGYLQTRLEAVWPAKRRLLGGQIGVALLVASVLFALGHLLVDFNGLRLAVFFPALVFGWMRSASGSILAGVLFHACSNLVSELLHASFS